VPGVRLATQSGPEGPFRRQQEQVSGTQVLARKWRPRSFSEITGQEHVVRALENALDQARLHHAYLLTGTRGVGKTTLARILAKALNCERGVSSTPCGGCGPCREIDAGRFVDLIELDAASNTQVDNMRELLENALYAPTGGRYKVYIIDEVHMLSRSAFNAMLKTLEEPPEHVKFVLATTDPQKIPVTVLSRCLQFNLKQIPHGLIGARLRHVLDQEGIPFQAPALDLIARAAAGSMRDGLSLLDQAIAYGGGRVEEEAVRGMLGAIDQSYLFDLVAAVAGGDGPGLLAIADDMERRSLSFDSALQDLATLFHRMALAQVVPGGLPEDLPERDRIVELAARFPPEEVQLCYQIALHGRNDLSHAPDEYAGFTMTLMRMLAFQPGVGTGGRGAHARPETAAGEAGGPPPRSESASGAEARSAVLEGNWVSLVPQLKLSGMARMLAQYCEVKRREGDALELVVPSVHRHLMEKTYQDKVRAALEAYLGRPCRVSFVAGETTGTSVVAVEERDRENRQAKAVESIESDPFVRELVENLDARLIQTSIKPIQ